MPQSRAHRRPRRRARIDWNGCPPLPADRRKLRRAAEIVLRETKCYITATTNGTHAPTSYHYRKRAIDFGSNSSTNRPEARAQVILLAKFGASKFRELFGPLDWYVKDGVLIHGRAPDTPDHLHCAI